MSQSSNISWWSGPVQWVATPTTPTAPQASSGRVIASSPEYTSKPSGALEIRAAVSPGFPAASLSASRFGTSRARRSSVAVLILRPVRIGMS